MGALERRSQARLRFTYAKRWIEAQGAGLSLSLPVRAEPFEHDECAAFFEGLLPEGEFLRAIARAFHVSADNPFALLSEIGAECAGAVGLGPIGGAAAGRAGALAPVALACRSAGEAPRPPRGGAALVRPSEHPHPQDADRPRHRSDRQRGLLHGPRRSDRPGRCRGRAEVVGPPRVPARSAL